MFRRPRSQGIVFIGVGIFVGLLYLSGCGDNDDPLAPEHGSASGVVQDQAGQGVAGASVRIWRMDDEHTATTGSGGTFSFSQLTPGAWSLEVTAPAGFELDPGQAMPVALQVQAGQTTEVTILLREEDENGDENGDNGPQTVEILARAASFDPSDRTIAPGTTVRWVNQAEIFHTVTPVDHTEWNEANLNSEGETFEHTFHSEGEFSYLCTVHAGMTGIIRVEDD